MGQSESDDTFVSELKAKELMVTRSLVLLPLFQWKNKNVYLITMGSLIFGIHIKISSDMLCPTILILPHPTLLGTKYKSFLLYIFALEIAEEFYILSSGA